MILPNLCLLLSNLFSIENEILNQKAMAFEKNVDSAVKKFMATTCLIDQDSLCTP